MKDQYKKILDHLPYKSSFRFVDSISFIDEHKVIGTFTLQKDAFYYEDHFKGFPVTPGVIITEIMAQIGLVVPGIYNVLQSSQTSDIGNFFPLLTSTEVEFFKMVMPGETVEVHSVKKYFRLSKLKYHVEMFNSKKELVAKGDFSGFIKAKNKV